MGCCASKQVCLEDLHMNSFLEQNNLPSSFSTFESNHFVDINAQPHGNFKFGGIVRFSDPHTHAYICDVRYTFAQESEAHTFIHDQKTFLSEGTRTLDNLKPKLPKKAQNCFVCGIEEHKQYGIIYRVKSMIVKLICNKVSFEECERLAGVICKRCS
eukprot:gnl/Trimastix_PCT/1474.p1 GENE.gnl/Trimastix_PCT/1474~~gnl/Trimastix_PCT/1474.p1  ORF type:complete len:157 (+),score=15.31 gnl/Trimastix_PCT/1474:125-595(+)